jgi:hypothetical protein
MQATQTPKNGVQIILTKLDPVFRNKVKERAASEGLTMKDFIVMAIIEKLRGGK